MLDYKDYDTSPCMLRWVKAVSWNVDNDYYMRDFRMELVFACLDHLSPDIIALQELSEPVFKKMIVHCGGEYESSGFVEGLSSIQNVLFVRRQLSATFSRQKISSTMNRYVIHATFDDFSFTSCHFDAFPCNKTLRGRQVSEVVGAVNDLGLNKSIICGDMNFIDESESFPLECWIDVGPPGATYDSLVNTNIKDNYTSRLDRVAQTKSSAFNGLRCFCQPTKAPETREWA